MRKAATVFLGTLTAFAAMTAVNASTGTDNLGKVTIGTDDAFSFSSTRPPVSFSDSVNFRLNSINADVTDTFTDPRVTGLNVSLFNDTTKLYVFQCTSGCALTDSFTGLIKGDRYSLIISGDTTGPKGSTSSIGGTLAITAVPEPATLAMILAGVGLLGVYHWRRRGKSVDQASPGSALA